MKIVELIEQARDGRLNLPPGYELRVYIDKGRAYFTAYPPYDHEREDYMSDPIYIKVEEDNGADQLYALMKHAGLDVNHA